MKSGFKRMASAIGSPRFATVALGLLGVWVAVGSFVPAALRTPLLIVAVLLLALSTTICAVRRTGVAARRSRLLRAARSREAHLFQGGRQFEIACDPGLDAETIAERTVATLGRLNVPARLDGRSVVAASAPLFVWGSPLFHWALVALILVVPLGGLVRSSGQMGLSVGQTKVDEPASYGFLKAGPLKAWGDDARSIRVDDFDVAYESEGVNRGPTPTVTVLDSDGTVLRSQRVYPNHTLKLGSLAIYPADYGLAADVSILEADGRESKHTSELLDFSGKAEDGTVPVAPLRVGKGPESFGIAISVPLDRTQDGFIGRLPEQPRAHVLVTSTDGRVIADDVLLRGAELDLPGGESLRLNAVGYYARLQVVDDPSVPLLYLGIVAAAIGLGVATFARQMLIAARVAEGPEGRMLVLRVELWRALMTSRQEIAAELGRALGSDREGTGQ